MSSNTINTVTSTLSNSTIEIEPGMYTNMSPGVKSFNGQTGNVTYTSVTSLNGETGDVNVTIPVVDNTNTISGAAADAKKTGDDIRTLTHRTSELASGTPTKVNTSSAMTDTSKLYLFTGTEAGFTAGHWYYYSGSAWVDGGQYGAGVIDDTLTVSGAAADAKVVGDELTDLEADLNSFKSGIDEYEYTLIKNSYPAADGTFPSYNNWDRTDYIPINGHARIYIVCTNLSNDNAWYDSSRNIISRFRVSVGSPSVIVVPENAKYMVLSNNASNFYERIYSENEYYATNSNLDNLIKYNSYDILEQFQRETVTRNGVTFTANADGSYTASGTSSATAYCDYYTSSDYLPRGIEPGGTYYIKYQGQELTFRVFVYVNGEIEDIFNSLEDGVVSIPSDADGIIMRISVASGKSVNETVNPKMLSGNTNEEICGKINQSVKVIEGVYTGTSIDDAEKNTIVIADGATVSGLPDTTHAFIVQTIYTTASYVSGQQTAYNFSTGEMFWRRKVAGTWDATWKDYSIDLSLYRDYRGLLPNGSDFDNLTGICTYLVAQDLTYYHAPFEGFVGTVDTSELSRWISIQTATELDTGTQYYRIRSGSQPTWKDWIKLSNKYAVSGKYVAFGDSVTWGAIWDRDQTTPYYQANIAYQIPTRIAIATGMDNNFINEADSGAGYYNQGESQSITEKIMSYDFTGVDLVTIMAGVNDKPLADHPLGTAENPVTGTICAAIKSIIDWFSANYPAVQIVIIQPTPSGHLANPWSDTLAAGWSLNTFDTEVSKLCAAEHVGYANWNDCTMCKNWDSFSGGYHKTQSGTVIGPNYSHMTNESDSMRIGDYIAAKVAMFYHGRN